MQCRPSTLRETLVVITTILTFVIPSFAGSDYAAYPKTAAVLQELYVNEVTAYRIYNAFAEEALAEDHPGVATLFHALSKAERIHAGNFQRLLEDLHAAVPSVPERTIPIRSIKENLRFSLETELAEIDTHYPDHIDRVRLEDHREAIRDITYAWKAEKQHRSLLRKVESGLGFFFTVILEKLNKTETYYVCGRCGSTLLELPKEVCPICGSSLDRYDEITGPPGNEEDGT